MNAQIVSFHCVLKNRLGHVLSSSFNRDVINQPALQGAENHPEAVHQRLRGLAAGIQNVRAGERRQFMVPAEEAYGPYDPGLVVEVRRAWLSEGGRLDIGSEVRGKVGPRGRNLVYRVAQIKGDLLVLDANHPLAGHDLIFDIEVVSARDARQEDFGEPEPGAVRYLN